MAPTPRKSLLKSTPGSTDRGPMTVENVEIIAPDEPFSDFVEQAVEAGNGKVTELHESVRKVAERNLEQTRSAYERFRAVTEETTGSFELSYAAAAKGLHDFNAKAVEALKSNADATFDLIKALMNVKSVSEAIALQTEHARKQFEALSAQAKELAEIAGKAAADSTEPLKASVTKTFGKAA